MKVQVFIKILIIFFCTISSTQLRGNILTYGDNIKERIINKPSQSDEEIIITAVSEIGTYPEFKGVTTLLDQLKKNVEQALRGNKPYRVKTNNENGTVTPAKLGNELVLEVTLIPCEQEKRHWYFEASAALYSDISSTKFSLLEGKVRMDVMDKAQKSFMQTPPQEAYPNNVNLKDFRSLNSADSKKEYNLIIKFLVGKRPPGFFEVLDETDTNNSNKNSNKAIENSSLVKVYLPNNQPPKFSDNTIEYSQQQSNKSVVKNANQGTFNDQRILDKEGQDSKFNAQVELKKVLLYEAAVKKSKLSNSKKQEALEKLSVVKKQMKDVIEIEKFGEDFDDALNHAEERDKNGKIVKSILSKYLNESDKILLLKILNGEIESDPESRNFGSYVCGTTIANCKFCGTRIKVNKYYQSLGGIFISLHRTPLIGLSIKEEDIKELKSYLGLIRSGKYYICIKNDKELFCTPEHKYLFDKR